MNTIVFYDQLLLVLLHSNSVSIATVQSSCHPSTCLSDPSIHCSNAIDQTGTPTWVLFDVILFCLLVLIVFLYLPHDFYDTSIKFNPSIRP